MRSRHIRLCKVQYWQQQRENDKRHVINLAKKILALLRLHVSSNGTHRLRHG